MLTEKYYSEYMKNKKNIRQKYEKILKSCDVRVTDIFFYIINKRTEYNPLITEEDLK